MSKTQYSSAGYDTTGRRSVAFVARAARHHINKNIHLARVSKQETGIHRSAVSRREIHNKPSCYSL